MIQLDLNRWIHLGRDFRKILLLGVFFPQRPVLAGDGCGAPRVPDAVQYLLSLAYTSVPTSEGPSGGCRRQRLYHTKSEMHSPFGHVMYYVHTIVTIRDHNQHTTTNTQPDFGSVLIKDRTKFEGSKMCHN